MNDVIQEIIDNLDRIPKEIDTKIFVKEISKQLAQEIGKKISL
jgi:hypothetical protein